MVYLTVSTKRPTVGHGMFQPSWWQKTLNQGHNTSNIQDISNSFLNMFSHISWYRWWAFHKIIPPTCSIPSLHIPVPRDTGGEWISCRRSTRTSPLLGRGCLPAQLWGGKGVTEPMDPMLSPAFLQSWAFGPSPICCPTCPVPLARRMPLAMRDFGICQQSKSHRKEC